jgi:hypothetical protein
VMAWVVKTNSNPHGEKDNDRPLSELLSAVETKLQNENKSLGASHQTELKGIVAAYNASIIRLENDNKATVSSLLSKHSIAIKGLEKRSNGIIGVHKTQMEELHQTNDQLETYIHAYNVVLDNYKAHVFQAEMNSRRKLQQELEQSNSCNAALKVQIDILKLGRSLAISRQIKPLEKQVDALTLTLRLAEEKLEESKLLAEHRNAEVNQLTKEINATQLNHLLKIKPLEKQVDVLTLTLRLAEEKLEESKLLAEHRNVEVNQLTKEINATQLNHLLKIKPLEKQVDVLTLTLQLAEEKLEESKLLAEHRNVEVNQLTKEINATQLNMLVEKKELETNRVQNSVSKDLESDKVIHTLRDDIRALRAQLKAKDDLLLESQADLVMIARESLG